MKYSVKWVLALMSITACQPQTLPTGQVDTTAPIAQSLRVATPPETAPARLNFPGIEKHAANGQLRADGKQVTLSLNLYPKVASDFQTKLLDLSATTKLHATLVDSHGKSYTPVGADGNGSVNYAGGTINLTFNNVTPNPLIIAEVEARIGTTAIPQTQLATALAYSGTAAPAATSIHFQSTVAAKALKTLLGSNAARARAIDLSALNALTANITGVSGTAPNFTYAQNHPSLVNTAALASALINNNPGDLTASAYRQSGATLPIHVSGLSGADKIQVQITDAASAVKTNLGNGASSISAATPGSGLSVKVTPFGAPSQTYNYSFPATVNLNAGSNSTLNIVATPTLQVSGINPTSGAPGTTVTITGSGFNGITAANGVSFSGVNANYTVLNDSTISATVPLGAIDGPITITKGAASQNSGNFDAHRVIFVKANATGSNTGRSWANAHPSLQTALGAAEANDDIWVAAGTYKPGNSRGDTFTLKTNVDIYGGFNGTESTLAARNFKNNIVLLSGDLNGNDNYGTTPAGNISDNSIHVVRGGNARLDGVTIQGGNSNGAQGTPDSVGGGLFIHGSSGNYRNLIFKHNHSSDRSGCLYSESATDLRLNNIAFSHCSGNRFGVAAQFTLSSLQEVKNLVFDNNQGTGNGSSSILKIEGLVNSASFENIVMVNNTATDFVLETNAFHNSGTPVSLNLNNLLMANNSALNLGVRMIGDASGSTFINNATLANNSCTNSGTGFCLSEKPGAVTTNFTLSNVLYWKDAIDSTQVGNNGNTDLGAGGTPFLNSADPDGSDNTWFTSNDGFNFANGTIAGVNGGISGGSIPTTDITGRSRSGATDVGAYEFIP